jgi:hypothetical protein
MLFAFDYCGPTIDLSESRVVLGRLEYKGKIMIQEAKAARRMDISTHVEACKLQGSVNSRPC